MLRFGLGLLAGAMLFLAPVAMGGDLLRRYWPMNDGDFRRYQGPLGRTTNFFQAVDMLDRALFARAESTASALFFYGYSDSGDELWLFGSGQTNGLDNVYDPPVIELDETLLLKGGTRKVTTTLRTATTNLPLTVTLSVVKSNEVKVTAATFNDCRTVHTKWEITQPGKRAVLASLATTILAPGVGIIKTAIYNSQERIQGWQQLTSGQVGGQDVRDIEFISPTVSITSPAIAALLTNTMVIVQGTAADNRPVAEVWSRVSDRPWELAVGTTNWRARAVLQPGDNRFEVYARDEAGNCSATNQLLLKRVFLDQLTLQVNGSGQITPDLRHQSLVIGQTYTLNAVPDRGWVLEQWTSNAGDPSPQSAFSFVMQSNLVLTAKFIPNPFGPLKGNYSGLFYPTNLESSVQPINAGGFNLALTDLGAFSGKLILQGTNLAFSGTFSGGGRAQTSVPRKNRLPLALDLELTSNTIRGQVSDVSWTSALLAYRSAVSKTNPLAGPYTLLFSPPAATEGVPPGDGIATSAVSAKSTITMSGVLADGTAVSQGTALSENGHWPLLVSLAQRQGLLIGWLSLGHSPGGLADAPPPSVWWIKPPSSRDRRYPAGFQVPLSVTLSQYTRPAAKHNAMEWNQGYLIAAGGDLTGAITNEVIATNGLLVVSQASLPKLKATLTPASGLINGSFSHPSTGAATTFKAVLIQQPPPVTDAETYSYAGGWFLGNRQGGSIRLVPITPPGP